MCYTVFMQRLACALSGSVRQLTDDRLSVARKYTELVQEEAIGVILSGSIAYGPYSDAVRPTSDVDLLVIVPDVEKPFGKIYDRTPHDISHFKEQHIDGYSPRKISAQMGIKTSIRVITEDAFEHVCTGEPFEMNVYKPIVKKSAFPSRGFDGTTISIERKTQQPSGFLGYITPSMNAFVHDGHYFMGSYIDRILGCGKVLHDTNGWVSGQMERCWKNVAGRLVEESRNQLGRVDLSHMSIAKALCRYDRMPNNSKTFVDEQTRKWVGVAMCQDGPAH